MVMAAFLTCLCYSFSSSQVKGGELVAVKEDDLEQFCRLVKKKDGGPPWKHVMERSTSDMSYQAWQRDPEVLFSTQKEKGKILDFVSWRMRLINSSGH